MNDLINISLGDAGVTALLGYMVVFLGLVLLMCVVMIMGRIMVGKANKAKAAAPELKIDGEMQFDAAFSPLRRQRLLLPHPPPSPLPAPPESSSSMTRTPETLPWSWLS